MGRDCGGHEREMEPPRHEDHQAVDLRSESLDVITPGDIRVREPLGGLRVWWFTRIPPRFQGRFGLPQVPRAAETVAATQFELDVSVEQKWS
jgi:hypothetical protein